MFYTKKKVCSNFIILTKYIFLFQNNLNENNFLNFVTKILVFIIFVAKKGI